MFSSNTFALLATALCALSPAAQVGAVPHPQATSAAAGSSTSGSSDYWLANVKHQGVVWGGQSDYEVFRNVMDPQWGVKGDGVTDDTEAINKVISSGNRCGLGCNSSTTTPAIIYFPPGNYKVSKPIVMYYYTQMIGDPNDMPTFIAASNFAGMAVLDSDPYEDNGANWYINQNNFFRQVRNFKIDLNQEAPTDAAAIHWQVAQATSLQNIHFIMKQGSKQLGIFMDNGSGGFFSDLYFSGGNIGAFLGSQQFTSRNLTFDGCTTAVFMNWNWGWLLSGLNIKGATVGVDMANSPANQTVGSVIISDSVIQAQVGVNSSFSTTGNVPVTGGTLILDNVDMSNADTAVLARGSSVLAGKQKVSHWASGNGFAKSDSASAGTVKAVQEAFSPSVNKNPNLLGPDNSIYGRSRPQYESVAASSVISAKDNGCKGDGQTDDTQCIQNFLNSVSQNQGQIAFFDHGAYLVSSTIKVPSNIKITGECWPLIVADTQKSTAFKDGSNPQPVFQVAGSSDTGAVEISDMLFSTNGPAPGAIMVEWNLNSKQGDSGMWDSHVRIGGSYGSNLLKDQCPGLPTAEASDKCAGVFLMFDAAPSSGGVYLENTWFWVADHDMEDNNQTQTSIYSARGALFRSSQGPTWLWGTASEHSMFYNYQISNITSQYGLFGGFMQSETPYFQPDPQSLQAGAFLPTSRSYDDPDFSNCGSGADATCEEAWGLRVTNSKDVLVFATGFYNFFNDYSQACLASQNCQQNMIQIVNSEVDMFTVTTKAAVNMIMDDSLGNSTQASAGLTDTHNRNVYGATLAYYINH